MSLFDISPLTATSTRKAPLAERMRPRTLAEYVGQDHLLGPGKPLRLAIENDDSTSMIFWGPPGTGKTTLAKIIAHRTEASFIEFSAVMSGIKEIKQVMVEAEKAAGFGSRTILFVDEIHRFNKSQQDALLPHVEDGTVTLIGATTENPSFELNAALLSRVRVIRLERLTPDALEKILQQALTDPERGIGGFLKLDSEAVRWLAEVSEGDARRALTSLETISLYVGPGKAGEALNLVEAQAALESSMERQPLPYDKGGEEHYNVISAFIKSLRDSDPHAGLYYLARMLESGEDPLFIARRLVILASEDVGNADPRALQIALSVKDAVDFVGMPEARINLAQGVTYIAMAPKSNASYMGIGAALSEVHQSGALPVPMHLRNAVTGLMKGEGYGQGYRYAHSEQGQRGKQTHLPEELVGKRYYEPKEVGLEKQIKEKLDQLNPDFDRKS